MSTTEESPKQGPEDILSYIARSRGWEDDEEFRIIMPSVRIPHRHQGKEVVIRALLDTASTASFVSKAALGKLNFSVINENHDIVIKGLSGKVSKKTRLLRVNLPVKGAETIQLECVEYPTIGNLPTCTIMYSEDLKKRLNINLEDSGSKMVVDVLIGQPEINAVFTGRALPVKLSTDNVITEVMQRGQSDMNLWPTLWGLTPSGRYKMTISSNQHGRNDEVTSYYTPTELLAKAIEQAWKADINEATGEMTQEELDAVDLLQSKILYDEERKRYQVPLLFKSQPRICNNYNQAMARLQSLLKSLRQQDEVAQEYQKSIQELIDNDIIEEVIDDKARQEGRDDVYWLPHRCVWRPEHPSTRCRIVFDGSSKMSNGLSLNEQLHAGPPMQRKISEMQLKFRTHDLCFQCDISKMFLRVTMDPQDRDYMRFLWQAPWSTEAPKMYRFKTVVFGFTSSPFLAQFVLQHHARKVSNTTEDPELKEAAQRLLEDTYVDDVIGGCESPEKAYRQYEAIQQILAGANFKAKKWTSNSKEFLKMIPEEDRAKGTTVQLQAEHNLIVCDEISSTTSLGVHWNPNQDVYFYEHLCELQVKQPYTKKSVASVLAKTGYDPIGHVSPLTMEVRRLLKEAWTRGLLWTEVLPCDLMTRFSNWLRSLQGLKGLSFPRHIPTGPNVEYYSFGDSSEYGYGACVYQRFPTTQGWHSRLVMARSRITPMSDLTIPKLEMKAATLAADIANTVREVLTLDSNRITCWTDSQVVLAWLKRNPANLIPYLCNRARYIHEKGFPFYYVNTKDNPADLTSRGVKPEELKGSMWQEGPAFLRSKTGRPDYEHVQPEHWTSTELAQGLRSQCVVHHEQILQPEGLVLGPPFGIQKKTKGQRLKYVKGEQPNIRKYYSSLSTTTKVLSCVLKAVGKFKGKLSTQPPPPNSNFDQTALQLLAQWEQKEGLSKELELLKNNKGLPVRSPLQKLRPIYDPQTDLLRVGGRLSHVPLPENEKHPILLPKKSRLAELLIREAHVSNGHASNDWTLAHVRQGYWPIHGRIATKQVTSKCIACRKEVAKPAEQIMADIPEQRADQTTAFSSTGLDYAGPLYVRTVPKATTVRKAWVCLFTCLTTRAVHLELVLDNETPEFLLAFKRFTSTRGMPKYMYSDNAGTFTRADKELQEVLAKANEQISQETDKFHLKWDYITPVTPHLGGIYERMIKSVKQPIRKILGTKTLTIMEMTTLLKAIEGILNDRPITQLREDSYEYLTPSQLMLGKRIKPLPQNFHDTQLPQKATIKEKWRQRGQVTRDFWRAWTKLYLPQLQIRGKWRNEKPNLKVGQLVILQTEMKKRYFWPLAIVQNIRLGRDGKVRTVQLRTKEGVISRGLDHVYPLEIEEETNTPKEALAQPPTTE